MEGLDLLPREPDQRVAVPQRVVHEGERVVLRQRHEPERDLGEVHRHRVPVHAVEAALRDQPAREDHLVLVGRDRGHLAVGVPGLDQRVAELAAGLDQERPRAHRRVADLEVEDLRGPGRPAVGAAQAREDRLERRAHDRLGERARRVVRARAAPLLARLEHHRALRHEVGRGGGVDHRQERRVQVLERRGLGRRPS